MKRLAMIAGIAAAAIITATSAYADADVIIFKFRIINELDENVTLYTKGYNNVDLADSFLNHGKIGPHSTKEVSAIYERTPFKTPYLVFQIKSDSESFDKIYKLFGRHTDYLADDNDRPTVYKREEITYKLIKTIFYDIVVKQ